MPGLKSQARLLAITTCQYHSESASIETKAILLLRNTSARDFDLKNVHNFKDAQGNVLNSL